MHIYLRLIQEKQLETYSPEESDQVRECMRQAPGVERVKDVSRHPKGGYAVQLEGSKEHIEQLIEYISSRGFRLVI
jgi:hypothetical protein